MGVDLAMAHHPTVSVMMPVYNASAFVRDAIEGLRAQTWTDFELLVLDDGSTDDSGAIVDHVARADTRIRVIHRENRGIAKTRNELLHLARGEFVAVNDADDISLPTRLERQVQYLRAHPNCVAVGSRMRFIDPRGKEVCEYFTQTSHAEIEKVHLAGLGSAMGHSSVMMRREAALRVGGYREEFPVAEDLDLWLRLAEIGELANLPDVLVTYQLHEASISHQRDGRRDNPSARAVREACQRRGLPVPAALESDAPAVPPHLNWATLALADSNYPAARRWAWRALRESPASWQHWKIFAHAMLGRHRGALRAARGGGA